MRPSDRPGSRRTGPGAFGAGARVESAEGHFTSSVTFSITMRLVV